MRRLAILALLLFAGCQKSTKDENENRPRPMRTDIGGDQHGGSGSGKTPPRPKAQQVQPPMDLKTPPADATKTASGLIYKKLVVNETGTAAKQNDTVLINYTGWRQNTGETFFTNKGRGQPMPLNLATTAPGFTEAMQLIKKGEKGVLWVPPSIGYKGTPQPNAETLVYEVEVVDIQAAPEIPADVAAAPATAKAHKSGLKYVVLRPGTGKEMARYFDTVTFNYTAWTADGKMFDSTEMRKRPASVPPFRQSKPMEEVLTAMVVGERVRFWIEAEKMANQGKPLPGMPTGMVCYELEITQIDKGTAPPPVPANVAKAPDNAKKTEKGVMYVVLKTGKGGPKPKPTESVKVNYTGWTVDGRMFDSSVVKGQPAEFSLGGVIAGWTDGIPMMSVGETVRFWIPEGMAYKGAPGRPQGMLVFDVELLEIKAAPAKPDAHSKAGAQPAPPAPPDVAAPPADAKKTPLGVSYKVLKAGPGGAKPTAASKVKVHYTGWQTDGKMFDSSITRGQPIEFSLGGVIAGWTDGLQVMSVGDKVRFWIPEEHAYKGRDPKGMLVFDVELLEIKN
jgi:FKBP-type peptidyl-prolyl cis-trans isomerase